MEQQSQKMKKLIQYLEEFIRMDRDSLDYDQIARNVLEISNASYVLFNLFEDAGATYRTVSLQARRPHALNLSKVLGFSVVGRTWPYNKERFARIRDQVITPLEGLEELTEGYYSPLMTFMLKTLFKTGKVYVVKIAKDDLLIGVLHLIMEQEEELDNPDVVELYARQTGMLLDRIRSEEKLKQSEEVFKSYTHNAPYGIFVVDIRTMRFTDVNPEASLLCGYSQEEILSMSPLALYEEQEGERVVAQIARIMQEGKAYEEFTLTRKEGTKVEISVYGVRLSDHQVMGFGRDITSRKNNQRQMQHLNLMMQTLLDNTPQGFVLIGKDLRILEFNKKSREFSQLVFGRTMNKGDHVSRYTRISERNTLQQILPRALKGEEVRQEITLPDTKKRNRSFELNLSPVTGEEGEVWAVAFTGYEITGLKETESALRASEERFRLAAQATSDLIYELDLHTASITWYGEAKPFLTNTIGRFPRTLRGWISCIHPEDQDKIIKLTRQTPDSRQPFSGEYRLVTADKSILYVEDKAIGVYDSQNHLRKVIGAIRDISARRYYEDQLKFLSFHDQLTGVYNRSFFEEEMSRLSRSRSYPISIIAVDLDGLKLINDTMGHYRGDEQLKKVAKILGSSIRGSDILARTGGDEFTLILPDAQERVAERVVARIEERLRKENESQRDLPLSISIGLATANDPENGLEETFKKADDYMYRSKLSKGNSAKSQIISSLMATLAERDYITEGHASRLSEICLAIGKRMGCSAKELSNLDLLAKVHDLGKVGIPDHILFKAGPLTEEEWEVMRLHPEKGFRIAISSPDLAGIADLILKHHERWDGKGYPLAISREEIPLECRILAVVDSYDAMTNDRPYAKARSREDACREIMNCAGSQFDPEITRIFLDVVQFRDRA